MTAKYFFYALAHGYAIALLVVITRYAARSISRRTKIRKERANGKR